MKREKISESSLASACSRIESGKRIMKVLFVAYNYLPNIDANVRIVSNICKHLTHCGVDVSILTYLSDRSLPCEEVIENQQIYRVKMSFFARVIRRLKRLFIAEASYIDSAIEKKVTRLVAENNMDIVVPVSQSIECVGSVLAVVRKNPDIKFMPYFLDPFSTSPFNLSRKARETRLEAEIYERCVKTVLTNEMYEENKENSFKNYLQKMEPLSFPNVQKLCSTPAEDDIVFDKRYINCVYVGFLYSDIRSTKFFFGLLKSCGNNDIVFHLIGGRDGLDADLEDAKHILGKRLIIHGKVSGQAAVNALLNADVLINIGNNVTNMVPSKIFEYISAGKPIVNTYKSPGCPTLKYTEKYPLCLDLLENQDISDGLVEEFEKFCVENKEKSMSYEYVEALYAEHTVESVGMRFYEILRQSLD